MQILIQYGIWKFFTCNRLLKDVNVSFPTMQRSKVQGYKPLKGRDHALIFSIVSGTDNFLVNTCGKEHRILFPRQSREASLIVQLLRICLQFRRPLFHAWVGKIPWRRKRLPTPGFWPGEFHGLHSPWGRTRLRDFHFTFSAVTWLSICKLQLRSSTSHPLTRTPLLFKTF